MWTDKTIAWTDKICVLMGSRMSTVAVIIMVVIIMVVIDMSVTVMASSTPHIVAQMDESTFR